MSTTETDLQNENPAASPTERPALPASVRADRRNAREALNGNRIHVLLGGEQTGGAFGLVEMLERHAPPRHIHHREDELIYVLEGELAFEIDGERFRAPAGTAVLVPRGRVHGFAIEEGPARLLVLFTPAGSEDLFLAASRPADAPAPSPGPAAADIAAILAAHAADWAATYGVEFVGPPVEPRSASARHDRMNGA